MKVPENNTPRSTAFLSVLSVLTLVTNRTLRGILLTQFYSDLIKTATKYHCTIAIEPSLVDTAFLYWICLNMY